MECTRDVHLEQCFSTWVPRNPEVPPKYFWVPPNISSFAISIIETKHFKLEFNNLFTGQIVYRKNEQKSSRKLNHKGKVCLDSVKLGTFG
jgi:hypothetical protein